MKKQKMKTILLCMLLCAVSGAACFMTGNQWGQKNVHTSSSVLPQQGNQEDHMIAVVNLDSGIELSGEQVYYGEKIIEFPSEHFIYTALEDARRGVDDGRYAAYIIVPSDFSQSVESLNGTPSAARLQYALSEEITGDERAELLYEVLQFGGQLNSQMSYMYLCNIMEEFHDAQDEAAMVMNNDAADQEAIARIQAYDLIELVPIPELKQPEDLMRELDVTEYLEANRSLIEDVDIQYQDNLTDAKLQLDTLKESGSLLAEELSILSESVQNIELQYDSDGQYLYLPGLQRFQSLMQGYNSSEQGKREQQLAYVQQAEANNQQTVTGMERSVTDYNQALAPLLQNMLADYQDKMQMQLPGLQLTQVPDTAAPTYRLTSEKIDQLGEPPVLLLEICQEESEISQKSRQCLQRILTLLLEPPEESAPGEGEGTGGTEPGGDDTETDGTGDTGDGGTDGDGTGGTEPGGDNTGTDDTGGDPGPDDTDSTDRTIETFFAVCDADEEITQCLQELQYDSTQAFLEAYCKGELVIGKETPYLRITGDVAELEDYISDSLELVETDSYQIPLYEAVWINEKGQKTSFRSAMTDARLIWEDMKVSLHTEQDFDEIEAERIVAEECIAPLVNRTEDVKSQITDKQEQEQEALELYQDSIAAYRPRQDTTGIRQDISEMSGNAYELQQQVRDSNQSYRDYAEEMYRVTQENIDTLQQYIGEAQEASDQAVTEGLAAAQEQKDSSSSENQSAMADFAAKLPYTRVGSMEYTQAYEFIIQPAQLTEVSDYQRLKDEVNHTVADSGHSGSTSGSSIGSRIAEYAVYGLFVLLAAGLAWYTIRSRRKMKMGQPAE